jgi:hypothetical protein
MKSLMICTPHQILFGDQIKKSVLDGAHGTYGGRRGAYIDLVWKPESRDHWQGPGLDGKIILKWIFRRWDGGMDWLDLAQNRGGWWAVVKEVMNFQVP